MHKCSGSNLLTALSGQRVFWRLNAVTATRLSLIISILSGSLAQAKNPLPPVRPSAQPSHLTDWILVAIAAAIIFAILHYLHRNRSKFRRASSV